MNLNQGTTWPLTGDVANCSPVFSPDGSQIAVSYRQHNHWEIHVLNADGSGRVRLTETPWRVIGDQRLSGEEPGYGTTLPRSGRRMARKMLF